MKLNPKSLATNIEHALAPVYLLTGDEPLQIKECTDAIRAAARKQGFTERQVMHVDAGFDWSQLLGEAASMSLFAERKLLDLRLPTGKPGREGGSALREYVSRIPEDTVLLIQSGKLDRGAKNSAWVKALDEAGVWVEIWDLNPPQTLQFVSERLRQAGFQADAEAARLLTEKVEGNLLAAAQEIEKLCLIREPGRLTVESVAQAVTDSARYDPFELIDAALLGDVRRVEKILWGLKGEGVHESQILWAISRDVRTLVDYSALEEAGHQAQSALKGYWGERQKLILRAVRRHSSGVWGRLLAECVDLDRSIKGLMQGNVWDELLQLLLSVAGEPVIKANKRKILTETL